MQYISRFSLKPYKAGEFRQWIQDNDRLLKEEGAKGWKYLGTWFTVHGFGAYDAEPRWEIDDYGSLGAGFGSDAYEKLMTQFNEFVEASRGGETYLMKGAGEVRIPKGS